MPSRFVRSAHHAAFGAWSAPAPRHAGLDAAHRAVHRLLAAARVMAERARTRRDLADMNAHLLHDIGITPGQRTAEARKWFWQH